MISIKIPIKHEKIVEFCKKWKIVELSFFGSVLRDDFNDDSDVDVLVTFASDARWSLFDHNKIEDELTSIIGRRVDLMTRRSIEDSPNWIRRKSILESAESYYAA
ncbi:nucleotidyltransferase domain-containing protein [bacterium]|nr:nucleotidyltransferase domain-containing protein [bacterium]